MSVKVMLQLINLASLWMIGGLVVPKISGMVIERSRRFLEPDEQVRRVILAQGGINPWLQVVFFVVGLIGVRIAFNAVGADGVLGIFYGVLGGAAGALVAGALTSRRVVLVTDRSVVVLAYGRFGGVKPSRLAARLPRDTRIGPLSGTWAPIELGGERLWVHKKWHGDAAAFEARLGR
ncbi:hypothetical protein ACQEV9_44620 [Streptomyces chartreusis]|uniref:hypothetical protein n=1 Tax=Streptomyces chartreusis TaxID=1969 RepID=UPI003D8F5B23